MKSSITIDHLKFRYQPNAIDVLDIDNLTIAPGECVFLRGPSGSGKSTLLNIVGGLLLSQSGHIEVNGYNLNKMSSSQRDHIRGDHLGFIFQVFNLVPYLTVFENIELALKFSKRKSQKVNDVKSEIYRLLSSLNLDPNRNAEKKVSELSVGQQQRVAAARALIGAPELIVADEPTSALDQDSREAFVKLLFNECRKTQSTLLFVSHDSTLGPLFDRVIDLNTINKARNHV